MYFYSTRGLCKILIEKYRNDKLIPYIIYKQIPCSSDILLYFITPTRVMITNQPRIYNPIDLNNYTNIYLNDYILLYFIILYIVIVHSDDRNIRNVEIIIILCDIVVMHSFYILVL